jgi:stage V sporulation protein G
MEITEARIKLIEHPGDRLKAFCSVTFDNAFVIRDLKIIEGSKGIFVAMPSRKITDHCIKCGGKNSVQSKFCCECGTKLDSNRGEKNMNGRVKLYADIAHPINSQTRDMIQQKVLQSYKEEVERSEEPGYKPTEIEEHPSEFQGI